MDNKQSAQRRWRTPLHSLRVKLTLWLVLVFAVAYVCVALAAIWLYRDVVRRSIDERLEEVADGVVATMQQRNWRIDDRLIQQLHPLDRRVTVIAVRAADGTILAQRPGAATVSLTPIPPDMQAAASIFRDLSSEEMLQLGGYYGTVRVVTRAFAVPGGGVHVVDIARTRTIDDESLAFVQEALLVGLAGALLASIVSSWMIAGRAVRPIHALTEVVRDVDPEHIDTRFDLSSTDREVEDLQLELNDALARIEQGFRAQEQFISHVAHDLKTPIAVILTESQVIKPEEASVEEVNAYRRSIIEEMQRMAGLIESFLTLALTDQGDKMARRSRQVVNDLVIESVARCDPEADQNEVRLVSMLIDADQSPETVFVFGDGDLLCTMLDNLIRNAIRHSPPGERIEIAATVDSGVVTLTVRDYGPGIDAEYIEHVFERFSRSPASRRRNSDGLGLGLAIAQSVVELHHGSIAVENCQDRGCRFTVTLPVSDATPAAGIDATINAD